MQAFVVPLFALALGAGPGAPAAAGDWVLASGTGTCSVTSVDFPDGPRGFAAGAFNCGLLTMDGGYSWTPIDVVPEHGQSLVWAHAASADELYAARLGFYRSTDRGASWAQVGPWDTSSPGSIFDVAFLASGRLVAIKGGQTWTSDDQGDHWTLRYPGEMDRNFHELHFPGSGAIGYATGGVVRGSMGNGIGTVLRTADAGATWTVLDFPHGAITAADFVDSDHAMVAVQNHWTGRLYVTSDGAATWQALPSAPPGWITSLKQRSASHWYAATADGCLQTSRNGGHSWQADYCDADFRALASINLRGGAAVAAGNDGLVLYEDRILRSGFEGP